MFFLVFSLPNWGVVVSTSKENGSAAHLAALNVDGEFVLIGGSKNSHLILSLEHGEEDLKLYPASPWSVAKVIMQSFFDLFKTMGKENTHKFLTILANWHMTAVFEMMDPEDQHVELLKNKKPTVCFITFTSGWQGEGQTENKLCMYPLHSERVASSFGVPTIQYEIVPMPPGEEERRIQFDDLQTRIRGGYGDEGRVLYYATEANEVIGVLKKKTLWYILLRALREKFKGYCAFLSRQRAGKPNKITTLEGQRDLLTKQIEKRLKEIQKWIGFTDACLNEWIAIGNAGNVWVYEKLVDKSLDPDHLGHLFPVVWNRFLTETQRSDKIPM